MTLGRTLLALIALGASTAAAAHTFWIEPVGHSAQVGDEVQVAFRIGDTGHEADDWGVYWERIASLRLIGPNGSIDQQSAVRASEAGEKGGAMITPTATGSYVLAFESNPSFSDLDAGRFNRYVANEGLTAIAAHRAANGSGEENGTELYSRRAKTLIQVGDERTANVTVPVGQTLEITPLQNPFALEEGEPLDLIVMWRGQPLEGARLSVAALDGSEDVQSFATSADGVVRVWAPAGKPVLYSVVWGVPAPNDRRADYLTIFASLTIAAP